MKIQLPNGEKIILEENTTIENKLDTVEKLIDEWYSVILKNWASNSIKYFLDGLCNYLVWHKEEEDKNKHDKEVLSIRKVEEMTGKRKTNSIPFSSLSASKKEILGIEGGRNG